MPELYELDENGKHVRHALGEDRGPAARSTARLASATSLRGSSRCSVKDSRSKQIKQQHPHLDWTLDELRALER